MARKKRAVKAAACMMCPGDYKLFGTLALIFGIILYLGYGWEMAFIVLGVLMLLKGLVK